MVRVYQLAKQLNITSKRVLEVAEILGINVKAHQSSLSEEDVSKIIKYLKKNRRIGIVFNKTVLTLIDFIKKAFKKRTFSTGLLLGLTAFTIFGFSISNANDSVAEVEIIDTVEQIDVLTTTPTELIDQEGISPPLFTDSDDSTTSTTVPVTTTTTTVPVTCDDESFSAYTLYKTTGEANTVMSCRNEQEALESGYVLTVNPNPPTPTTTTTTSTTTTTTTTTTLPSTIGIVLEGPPANQSGTEIVSTTQGYGWISIDEQLGAGQRLAFSSAFFTDLVSMCNNSPTLPYNYNMMIGLKGDNWANTQVAEGSYTYELTGNAFKGNSYLLLRQSNQSNISLAVYNGTSWSAEMWTNNGSGDCFGNSLAFIEITPDGDNIRFGFGRDGNYGVVSGDESTVPYEDWFPASYKGETGDQNWNITNADVMILFKNVFSSETLDGADVDWTLLTEVATPVP